MLGVPEVLLAWVVVVVAAGSTGQECWGLRHTTMVLISQRTQTNIRDQLVTLSASRMCPLSVLLLSAESDLRRLPESIEVLLDLLSSQFLSMAVLETVTEIPRVLNANEYEINGISKVFLPEETETAAMSALLQWMKLDRVCVFLSENAGDQRTSLASIPELSLVFFIISDEIDSETITLLVRKQVKPQGFSSFLILLPPTTTLKVLLAISENNVSEARLDIIMSRESFRFRLIANGTLPDFARTGPVSLIDSGCEETASDGEYLLCRAELVLSGSPTTFSVLNIVNEGVVTIGRIAEDTVRIYIPIAYPAAAASLNSTVPVLTVSFNNGTLNPGNIDDGTSEPPDYLGVQLAIADINRGTVVLPYHDLTVFNVTLGLFEFDEMWAKGKMEGIQREDLGVAMITGEYSGVAMGVYSLMSAMNYSIAQAGASNTSPVLTSPKDYPLYARISMSDAYMSVLYGRMLQHYGWSNIVMLYCDDPWSVSLYNLIQNETRRLGITINNKEEYRMLPTLISNSSDYLRVYEDIVTTKVRIVIMILYGEALYLSLEALYDLGLRRGDVFFLATEWLYPDVFMQEDKERDKKLRELCNGAVQFYPATTVGEFGAKVAQEYKDNYGEDAPFYSCFYYDATYLVAYAVDFLLSAGDNYESAVVLNKAMRETRFRGCTGIVTIEEGKNDRSPMMYSISNARVFEDGSFEIKIVGTYDPAGMVLFNFTDTIVWPDNTTIPPSDVRINSIDCPFEEKQIVTFIPGVVVAYLALAVLAIISVGITVCIWRKWWNSTAEQLLVKAEISFDDYILFATIAIECLQYSAMGPDFPSWAQFLTQISDSMSINMETFIKLKHGMFWTVLNGTLGGVCAWIVFMLIIVFHLDLRYECLCSRLGELGEKLLPILGNMCFLPIISTLMNVFQCSEAVDQGLPVGFLDTFLKQDCYQMCWQRPHIYYAIASVFGLFLYLPMAVFLRPSWQNMQPYLHVKTSPAYLMLKTIYQISIIVLNKTLKQIHATAHAGVFLFVTGVFCGFTLKWRPYGYNRPNLWHTISMICVLWIALLTLINLLTPSGPPGMWVGLFLFGLASLFTFGIVWQVTRTKAMLYRPKGIHVVDLFKFMFSRGSKYLYLFRRNRNNEAPAESERQLARQANHVLDFSPTLGRGVIG